MTSTAVPVTLSTRSKPLRYAWLGVALLLLFWASLNPSMISNPEGFGTARALVVGLGMASALMAWAPFKVAAPALAMFVSTAVALVGAEWVLQAMFKPRFYTAFEQDAALLFKLRPGAKRDYQQAPELGGQVVRYEINADGFRGPPLRPLTDGHRRVMVYGDSFIHVEYTPLAQAFTTQLAQQLVQGGTAGVEVINAGVAGYGPDQILRRMPGDLATHKPDLVVVSIFSGNDYGDLLRNRLYKLDAQGRLEPHAVKITDDEMHRMQSSRSEPILRKILRNAFKGLTGRVNQEPPFERKSYIEQSLQQHLAEYQNYIVDKSPYAGDFAVDPYAADVALMPSSPSATYRVAMMREVMRNLSLAAQAAKVPLVVMIVPHPMDLMGGDHDTGWVDKAKYPQYEPTRMTGHLASMARELQIPYLNLYPVLRDNNPLALFYKGGDDHWNAQGQAVGAKALADFMQTQGWLVKK
jgi:lysophospholipase L1-like esterase